MSNPLFENAEKFADRILDMCDYLLEQQEESKYGQQRKHVRYSTRVIVEQITRSGTSIGANISEGQGVQSKADLTAKFSISFKEANETYYWLRRMKNHKIINETMYESLNNDLQEILRLLTSSLNTLKNK